MTLHMLYFTYSATPLLNPSPCRTFVAYKKGASIVSALSDCNLLHNNLPNTFYKLPIVDEQSRFEECRTCKLLNWKETFSNFKRRIFDTFGDGIL